MEKNKTVLFLLCHNKLWPLRGSPNWVIRFTENCFMWHERANEVIETNCKIAGKKKTTSNNNKKRRKPGNNCKYKLTSCTAPGPHFQLSHSGTWHRTELSQSSESGVWSPESVCPKSQVVSNLMRLNWTFFGFFLN